MVTCRSRPQTTQSPIFNISQYRPHDLPTRRRVRDLNMVLLDWHNSQRRSAGPRRSHQLHTRNRSGLLAVNNGRQLLLAPVHHSGCSPRPA